MKKLAVVVAALALVSTSAFAKKWTNNIGLGINVPVSQVKIDEDNAETIKQVGFAFDVTYLGIHENGFCAKVDYDVGAYSTDDVLDESTVGLYQSITLGAGWALVHDNKLTVTATGMFGIDFSSYTQEKSTTVLGVTTKNEVEINLLSFSVGADLFASYRLKEHFGLYGNLGVYYLPTGSAGGESRKTVNKTTTTTKFDDTDLKGKFRVSPTIGIVWNW